MALPQTEFIKGWGGVKKGNLAAQASRLCSYLG